MVLLSFLEMGELVSEIWAVHLFWGECVDEVDGQSELPSDDF